MKNNNDDDDFNDDSSGGHDDNDSNYDIYEHIHDDCDIDDESDRGKIIRGMILKGEMLMKVIVFISQSNNSNFNNDETNT